MKKAYRAFFRGKNAKKLTAGVLTLLVIVCAAFFVPADKWHELADSVGVSLPHEVTASADGDFVGQTPDGEKGFFVYFIDVGQADSAVVYCDGYYMLIDAGNVADGELVASRLDMLGADKLEYVIGTHAHEDHMGGLAYVLEGIDFGTLYAPAVGSDDSFYSQFANTLSSYGKSFVTPAQFDTFALGSARCVFLSPTEDEFSDLNDTSLILRITYGDTSFLFMGDASKELERSVIESGADVSADLIKIGHHGSESSTSYRLLYEAMPTYAVISVGAGNRYGHPDEQTLSILADAEVLVYRTDECGDIKVSSDGKMLVVTPSVK